ncbi:melanophilin isoform X3 [Gallus gallus]|uniref:melanophilin isoform X3 n=1 Tax=Gallus gallus TaxID=9031 RepID=UPI000739D67A|nr:melanophilin isoform X3 [Gallus gallus]|eukprot:XP_015144652.1 melanophilin isoform X2 [Gallus gallus]
MPCLHACLPWGGALRPVGSTLPAQHEWFGSSPCKMGRKLDLSKLTDEEAKHVWEVVQRDFDLRKKEEERLEDLKCKIDQESSKREFLTHQSHLNETHCVHCLQPFKFLLNSKRQCLDCRFYTCKSCSRYNKREQGWVCDPCRLSRVVKIGSLEWYYEHVRSRFKRFGSAKVLQSLYGRLQPGQKGNSALLGLHDRVYSLPDINSECQLPANGGIGDDSEDEDDALHGAEAECYSRMRKTKRLLSVHPFDFELDSDYSAQSRRQSAQLSPVAINSPDAFQSFPDFSGPPEDAPREPRLEEADLAAVFHILREQEQHLSPPEQHFSTEVRLTLNARRRSLDRSSKPGSPWVEQPRSPYSADMDTSDEDVKGAPKLTACLPHYLKRRSRASSQENISHNSGSQIHELNKRMSVIERVLNRLEEKLLVRSAESPATESQLDPDAEEEELKRKLEEFTSHISDREVSSEEEGREERKEVKRPEMNSSSDDIASEARKRSSAQSLSEITAKALRAINATEKAVSESLQGQSWGSDGCALHLSMEDGKEAAEAYRKLEENVYLTAGKAYQLETTLTELEEGAQHCGTTDLELSELEDKVASAAAQVQQAESEISDIESRIAALSAAGLTVKPLEKARKKSNGQAFHLCSPNLASSPGESLDDVKAMSGPQVLRRRFNSPFEIAGLDDSFDRNSVYRGSLTQRNPNGKNRRVERLFAKPVMTHLS